MFRSRKGQAASEADVRRDQPYQSRTNVTGSRLRVRRGSSLTDLDKLRCSTGSSGGGSIGDLMNMFSGSANSVGSDTLVARTVPLETVRRNIPAMTTPPSRPPSSPLIHVSRPVGPLTMAQRTLRFSRLLKYQPSSADVLISLVSDLKNKNMSINYLNWIVIMSTINVLCKLLRYCCCVLGALR